jgi:hypothetical protein
MTVQVDPIYVIARNRLITEASVYATRQVEVEIAMRPLGSRILDEDTYNSIWNRCYHRKMNELWQARGAEMYKQVKESRENRGILADYCCNRGRAEDG